MEVILLGPKKSADIEELSIYSKSI